MLCKNGVEFALGLAITSKHVVLIKIREEDYSPKSAQRDVDALEVNAGYLGGECRISGR